MEERSLMWCSDCQYKDSCDTYKSQIGGFCKISNLKFFGTHGGNEMQRDERPATNGRADHMTELEIEIAFMSETEAKNAIAHLVDVLGATSMCTIDGEGCPAYEFCQNKSVPCDLAWLRYAKAVV